MSNLNLEQITYPADNPKARLLLAHGAGAGNKHPFMDDFAKYIADKGIEVISFNFPYMQVAYETEKKRPPNSNKQLNAHFAAEIAKIASDIPVFIAGKSMGGRVATQIMASDIASVISGCIVLGYPFIPPGKPEKLEQRTKHFPDINKPLLILQGERDSFGGTKLLSELELPEVFQLTWVISGDHSFKPLKSSGLTHDENLKFAAMQTSQFIETIIKGS